jgi:hypothetical protein
MPVVLSGTNGVTFPDSSLQAAAASPYVLKNRIINGDMRIDQRRAGASATANDNIYGVDRWVIYASQSSKLTCQQNQNSVTPPAGFTNYLGYTSSSAYTVGGSEYFSLTQAIEGYNISDLGFGTANAKTVTVSFWVRSSLTGTFGGALRNADVTRTYPFSYTISSANTWEYKTITIPGDTSGTWNTTNGYGLAININLGAGSAVSGTAGSWANAFYCNASSTVNLVGTNGATFYITGVQLEIGTTATPFERRMYGNELALCQRYYYQQSSLRHMCQVIPSVASSSTQLLLITTQLNMRTTPSCTGVWTDNTTGTGTPTIRGGANPELYFEVGGNSGFASLQSYTLSAEL